MSLNNNIIVILISMFIIYGYTTWVRITYGIQKSISDSVYIVKPWWLFVLTMMLFPIPFMIVAENIAITHNAIDVLNQTDNVFISWLREFTAFWAGALICLVGVANCFMRGDKQEETLHVIGATGGITLGLIFTVSLHLWYLIPVSIFILYVLYCTQAHKFRKYDGSNKIKIFLRDHRVLNHTWRIEMWAIHYLYFVVWFELLIHKLNWGV